MWMVVGLGNHGKQYTYTRHNVGSLVVSALADRLAGAGAVWKPRSFLAKAVRSGQGGYQWTQATVGEHTCVFVIPCGYMNHSGQPVRRAMAKLNVDPSRLIVIHDDLDLSAGQVKLRLGGGSGGHNGIRSIAQVLGSEGFKRIKVGIGRPEASSQSESCQSITQWVLSRLSEDELARLHATVLDEVICRLQSLVSQSPDK